MSEISLPNSTSPMAASPVKRKRGARFWVFLSTSVIIGLAALLFLGAWAAINLGWLDNVIAHRISKRVGMTVRVGDVKTDALRNLSIQNIVVERSENGEAQSVSSVKLDFSLLDMLSGGRLRGVNVEFPEINVSYKPNQGWSPALKMASEPGEGMQIDRFKLRDGTFSLGLPKGERFTLSKIYASIENERGQESNPFALHGELQTSDWLSAGGWTKLGMDLNGDSDAFGIQHASLQFSNAGPAIPSSAVSSDAKQASLGVVRCDIGKFFESALGHTLFEGNDRAGAAPSFLLSGTVTSKGIEAKRFGAGANSTNQFLDVRGLALNGVAVKQWPFDFSPPDVKLSGSISALIQSDEHALKKVVLFAVLSGEPPASKSVFDFAASLLKGAASKCAGHIQTAFVRGADGALKWSGIDASDVSLPLASVGTTFRLMEKYGVRLEGGATEADVHYDAATGVTSGKLKLENAEIRCAIPQSFRDVARKALEQAGKVNYAMALDSVSESGLKKISGEFTFNFSREHFELKGHVSPTSVFATGLGAVDFEEFTLPSSYINFRYEHGTDGGYSIRLWAGPDDKSSVTFRLVSDANGKVWFSVSRPPPDAIHAEVILMGNFNLEENQAGPFTLNLQELQLSSLGTILQSFTKFDLGKWDGSATGLRVMVNPFPLDPQPQSITTNVAFDSASFGAYSFPQQKFSFDVKPDKVILQMPIKADVLGQPVPVNPQEFDFKQLMKLWHERAK